MKSDPPINIKKANISLALVCHKEGEKLALVLEDIKRQSAFKQIVEVLLFQNGDCLKTRKTALSFASKLPLQLFSSPENHLGKARAFLVQKAKSPFIAWTDSDCRLQTDWLESLINNWAKQSLALENIKFKGLVGPRATESPTITDLKSKRESQDNPRTRLNTKNLLAVGGPNRLPEDKTWKKIFNLSLSVFIGHGFSPQALQSKRATAVRHIPTCNGLFLKKAIMQAGNFSNKQELLGEDLDLGLRMSLIGKMFLCPNPLVINNFAESYLLALKRLFLFGTVQTRFNNRFFYPLLLFFPVLILGLLFSLFYILSGEFFMESFPFNPPSPLNQGENPISELLNRDKGGNLENPENSNQNSILSKLALFGTSLYFVLLIFGSFVVLFKSKSFLALALPFFWLVQHCAYSIGANKRLLSLFNLRFLCPSFCKEP